MQTHAADVDERWFDRRWMAKDTRRSMAPMVKHDPGCSRRHSARQHCDGHGVFIDWGRVQSCLIALPILLPFIVLLLAFSGDSEGVTAELVVWLVMLTGSFLLATYSLLTAIDWIVKHL